MYNTKCVNRGFTLIELIVTVSIAAVLMAIAVPSFTLILRNNRLTAYSNDLIASLNLARSEAVKRGQHVVVRKTGANWEDGWEIFIDVDRIGASANNNTAISTTNCKAGNDCGIKKYPAIASAYTLRGGNNIKDFIRYTPAGTSNYIPDGLANITNDYFVICDNRDGNDTPEADTARLITLNTVGRARLALDTSSPKDGIPNLNKLANVATCKP